MLNKCRLENGLPIRRSRKNRLPPCMRVDKFDATYTSGCSFCAPSVIQLHIPDCDNWPTGDSADGSTTSINDEAVRCIGTFRGVQALVSTCWRRGCQSTYGWPWWRLPVNMVSYYSVSFTNILINATVDLTKRTLGYVFDWPLTVETLSFRCCSCHISNWELVDSGVSVLER